MLVLGIETTCDETAASLVKEGREILSNVVASSADIHEKYGGVFPELACRRHIDAIVPVIKEALRAASSKASDIDAIAVAKGPGLVGALLIGMQFAKGLSIAWKKPLLGINHVEAHLYAAMMSTKAPLEFPSLGIVVSGGHTLMLKIEGIGQYQLIGTTVDDAVGEAFDKVASLLGLPYPGGPPLEALAAKGDKVKYGFKAGRVKRSPFDFSFSGLKTSVLYAIKGKTLSDQDRADVAASFQEAALGDLATKASLAVEAISPRAIYLGGGVCNNRRLRELFTEKFRYLPTYFPSFELTLDNAAMIAGLGYHKFLENQRGDTLDLEVETRIPIA